MVGESDKIYDSRERVECEIEHTHISQHQSDASYHVLQIQHQSLMEHSRLEDAVEIMVDLLSQVKTYHSSVRSDLPNQIVSSRLSSMFQRPRYHESHQTSTYKPQPNVLAQAVPLVFGAGLE